MSKFLFTIFVALAVSGCVSTAVDRIPSEQFQVINVTVHRAPKNMGLWPHMFRSNPESKMAEFETSPPQSESADEVYKRSLNTAAPIAQTTYSDGTAGGAVASGVGGAVGGAIVASIVNSHNQNLNQISQGLADTIKGMKFPEEWENNLLSDLAFERKVNVTYTDAPAQDPTLSTEELNLSMVWYIDTLTTSRNFITTTGASVNYWFFVYGKYKDGEGKITPVLQALNLIVADFRSSTIDESIIRWADNNGELVRDNLDLAFGIFNTIVQTTIENLSRPEPKEITSELLGLPKASITERSGSHSVFIKLQ